MAAGLTCTNGKGDGFFLNRETWRAFKACIIFAKTINRT